jgi:hypothetical protein
MCIASLFVMHMPGERAVPSREFPSLIGNGVFPLWKELPERGMRLDFTAEREFLPKRLDSNSNF